MTWSITMVDLLVNLRVNKNTTNVASKPYDVRVLLAMHNYKYSYQYSELFLICEWAFYLLIP